MSPFDNSYPVAISRLSEDGNSREQQSQRAIKWLLKQSGGPIIVVTPKMSIDRDSLPLNKLISKPGVTHRSWRGLSATSFSGQRVLHAWPDRKRLNDLWDIEADALAVVEWSPAETEDWIDSVNPVQLYPNEIVEPSSDNADMEIGEPLPDEVERILEYIAAMAAGYSTGLKWNEEDKLKADMMNRPECWAPVAVEQVRVKCRQLGMSPKDSDTIAGFLQRCKEGPRFNVRDTYRDFKFR